MWPWASCLTSLCLFSSSRPALCNRNITQATAVIFILWQPNFYTINNKSENPKEDNFIMFYITQYIQNSSILECIIRLKINSSHSFFFFLPNLKFSVCFTLSVDQPDFQYLRAARHELSWYWPVQVQRTRSRIESNSGFKFENKQDKQAFTSTRVSPAPRKHQLRL